MSEGARNVLKGLKMRDARARTFTLRVPCSPYFARVQGDKTMTDKKKILLSQNFSVAFYLIFFNLSGRVTNAIYLLSQDVFIVAWC